MLTLIRVIHTVVWALFVAVIFAIPVLGWYGHFGWAVAGVGAILVEGAILLVNRGRCPLSNLAARYVGERRANFDIYLPEWLAKHNKQIFTTLFLFGCAFSAWRWAIS